MSVTHLALSSTRMATCAMLGQAVGTVVSFASSRGLTLRETGAYAAQWKQMLRDDDCHLLHTPRRTFLVPEHIQTNASYEQLHILFNGVERALNESDSPAVSPCICPWNLPLKAYMPKNTLLFDSDIASSERRNTARRRGMPRIGKRAQTILVRYHPLNIILHLSTRTSNGSTVKRRALFLLSMSTKPSGRSISCAQAE